MKQLAVKSVLMSIIVALIIMYGFDPLFRDVNENSKTFNDFEEKSKKSLDILIVGSSHAKNAYIPTYLDSIFNTHTYNLGTGGQSFQTSNLLIQNVLKEQQLKLVIVDLFPAVMKKPVDEKPKASQLRVLDYAPLNYAKIKTITSIYNYQEWPSVLSETVRNHDKWYDRNWTGEQFEINENLMFSNGFLNTPKTMNTSDRQKYADYKQKIKDYYQSRNLTRQDDIKLEEMKSLIDETTRICEEANVELLFVSAPYFSALYRPGLNNSHYHLRKYFDTIDYEFIDFNMQFDLLELSFDDFWNGEHLNIKGAKKITNKLAESLSKLGYIDTDYELEK